MIFQKEYITSALMPEIRELWQSAPTTFPDFLPDGNTQGKKTNEDWITESMERIQLHMKAYPSRGPFSFSSQIPRSKLRGIWPSRQSSNGCAGTPVWLVARGNKKNGDRLTPRQQIWMQEMEDLFCTLLITEPVLGIRNALPPHTLDAFQAEMKVFLRKVRSFAPDMKLEDMGQAIRNYMVYAIFREQNGLSQECPSSIFGYSMLYPFTDNFLDDPAHTEEEKKHYNLLIHHKISGQPVTPLSLHEEKTAMLLDSIAQVYPGPQADDAYGTDSAMDIRQGLLLMLEAQETSQKQTDASLSLSERNILDISIYKGGLSVLIDRYFINHKMTEDDILFYFGFGFLLQLSDDLQDIAQDQESGSRTLLSRCRTREETEAVVNKLFHYTDRLFQFSPCPRPAFRDFLLQNCYQLILSSAAGSGNFFSGSYLEKLEEAFPVSFSYLNQMKEKIPTSFSAGKPAEQGRMMDMLDAFLCAGPV